MRSRLRLGIPLAVALCALMTWWTVATARGWIGYEAVSQAPDGTAELLSLFEVAELRPPDAYVVSRGSLSFVVRGDPAGLRVGEELSVGGVLHGGELVESWRAPAPGRGAKKALGLLGLAIGAGLLLATVRPTPEGLVWRG